MLGHGTSVSLKGIEKKEDYTRSDIHLGISVLAIQQDLNF